MLYEALAVKQWETKSLNHGHLTLPETNSKFAPENRPKPKRKPDRIPTIWPNEIIFHQPGFP